MREIMFRGKRIDNGEWVYGMPYSFKRRGWDKPHYSLIYILMWNPDWDLEAQFNYLKDPKAFAHLKDSSWKVIPESVGQYIGKKDKNKAGMYDGDIIKARGYKHNSSDGLHFCCIEWWEDFAQWGLRRYKWILDDGRVFGFEGEYKAGFRFEDIKMETLEIVGNLTDNPELVKSDTENKRRN